MKLVVVTTAYPSKDKADSMFVHQRVKEYFNKGHQVLVFKRGNTHYSYENIEVIGCGIKKTIDTIKKFKPDAILVHAPSPVFASWMYPFLKKYPIITWIHGYEVMNSEYYDEKWYETRGKLWLNKLMLDKSNKIICVSEWMKKVVVENMGISPSKIVVIPNHVENFFEYKQRDFSENKYISVRNFGDKYGLKLSQDATRYLRTKVYKIIGRGNQKQYNDLRELNHNTEIFNGHMSHKDLMREMENYNCFIAPSREEAQGVAMCEAMRMGMNVITTNVGGIPEFVEDSVTGIVCKDKVSSLISGIKKYESMSNKEKQDMSKRASDFVHNNLDENKLIDMELKEIERCLFG